MELNFDGTAQIILASCYGVALLISASAQLVKAIREASPQKCEAKRSARPENSSIVLETSLTSGSAFGISTKLETSKGLSCNPLKRSTH